MRKILLLLIIFSLPIIKIDKSFRVIYFQNETTKLVFPVAIGTPKDETKEGVFKIINKSIDPNWFIDGKVYPPYKESKENALGIRWLGISWIGYGIHGTNEPFSIGKNKSQGCIRLQNKDIVILYQYLDIGDKVQIFSSEIDDDFKKGLSLLYNFYNLKTFIEEKVNKED
ncbi:MAG: L,D-transpeptidase [Caldisericia bacterium]|nr:L,D-transpeptidase [Caldisericia bacterium]